MIYQIYILLVDQKEKSKVKEKSVNKLERKI